MNIFFDLDGTLLDSRERLYQLFQHLVPESTLSFEKYWSLKRNKISHKEILQNIFSYSNEMFSTFENAWMEKIELPEWLALDKPFTGVTNYLIELKKNHVLYVITARQFEDMALQQIEECGWRGIFEKVLVTGQSMKKIELIQLSCNLSSEDWFVGDTGNDINAGKKLGIKTAAVLSGFLNKEKLLAYNPDLVVVNIVQLKF
jgi:phosphoglycolate phosphatase